MPLKHADIWRAIDRLAEQNSLSASGLAKKAGLSPTVFNPSKRISNKRPRWPSTESIAFILQATNTALDEFVALATHGAVPRASIPLIGLADAEGKGAFDHDGKPSGRGWEEMRFPALADAEAFALEVSGKELAPAYREGDRLIIAPAEKPRRNDRVALRTHKGDIIIGELARESVNRIELLALGDGDAVSFAPREIDWMYKIVWASQ
jgi:phage repressor protein C with HTH and peptisase S24 domain